MAMDPKLAERITFRIKRRIEQLKRHECNRLLFAIVAEEFLTDKGWNVDPAVTNELVAALHKRHLMPAQMLIEDKYGYPHRPGEKNCDDCGTTVTGDNTLCPKCKEEDQRRKDEEWDMPPGGMSPRTWE
jgi:hypothetical protein